VFPVVRTHVVVWFIVIRSNRPEIEIWKIFNLYSEQLVQKSRIIISFRKTWWVNLMVMSEF